MKNKRIIFSTVAAVLLFALAFWVLDAVLYNTLFHNMLREMILRPTETFTEALITDIPDYNLFIRLYVFIVCALGGVLTAIAMVNQRKTRLELERSEKLLRTIINTTPTLFFVKDREYRYVLVNEKFTEAIGKSNEEVIGKKPIDLGFTHEEIFGDNQRGMRGFQEDDRQIFETGKPLHNPNELATLADGTEVIYDSHKFPLFDENNEVWAVMGFSYDITSEVEAHKKIKNSESFQRAIIDNMPDWVFAKDREFRYILANKSYADAIGLTPEEMIGKTDFEIGFPEDQVLGDESRRILGYRNSDIYVFEKGEKHLNPYDPATLANGQDVIFQTQKVPLFNSDGEVWAVLGFCHDLTTRIESEEALADYNRALEIANTELQQYAYVASHDLQEPLRSVASFLQLLQRRYADDLDETANEYIDHAVDGAKRMKVFINDLLKYSRVSTHTMPPSPADLNTILEQVKTHLQPVIDEKKAVITHDELPTLIVEVMQITQVFQNLISNALKFSKEGVKPEIHIGVTRENSEWIFSVKDNGIGIDPQFHDQVFILFKRLHTRSKYEGTGIGLAICKRIVEQHGGRIWIDSKSGEGSTFFSPSLLTNKQRR